FYFDWHAPEGPAQKLVLCDDAAGVSSLGEIPFNPDTATEVSTDCISSFRYRARTGPSSVEIQDYTFRTPAWPGYYSHAAENLNGQFTRYEIFDYPGRFKDESHGRAFGTKTQMTIRSKTYKGDGFNELRFEDATGQEQVYIHAQKNMDTEVLHDRTTTVKVNHNETIGANQTITVKQNQVQTVVQNQQETVGQNQSVTVGMNQAETVGIVRALSVGVAYQTTVGGVMNTSVALMQSSQIGIQKSLLVGKGYDVSVGENVTFSVGKSRKESAGKVAVYSAGEHLELVCGQARLVLTQDGGIFLNGTAIHLQGAQAISGDGPVINWNCGVAKNPPDAPEQ
ncbi:type VI secretion system tip protein VgrG, partial [Salmonella bongori]|nr:type VI secretion system tip protein VgrG [Salmonella bongori]